MNILLFYSHSHSPFFSFTFQHMFYLCVSFRLAVWSVEICAPSDTFNLCFSQSHAFIEKKNLFKRNREFRCERMFIVTYKFSVCLKQLDVYVNRSVEIKVNTRDFALVEWSIWIGCSSIHFLFIRFALNSILTFCRFDVVFVVHRKPIQNKRINYDCRTYARIYKHFE